MNADFLISLVLNEASLFETSKVRKAALIGVRDTDTGREYVALNREYVALNRTAERRMRNFPQTLNRFSKDWGVGSPPELPSGERYQTRDRILGPRTSSQQREMRIGVLLPTLAYRAGITFNNTDHIPQAEKEEAKVEYDRLLNIELDHLERRNRRAIRRLNGLQSTRGGRGVETKAAKNNPHDAWDHGYTGTTPSEMGEIEAAGFEDQLRRHPETALKGSSLEKRAIRKNLEYNRRRETKDELSLLFMELSHPFVRHDIPHESLMAWSRAMQPRAKRKKFLSKLEKERTAKRYERQNVQR